MANQRKGMKNWLQSLKSTGSTSSTQGSADHFDTASIQAQISMGYLSALKPRKPVFQPSTPNIDRSKWVTL